MRSFDLLVQNEVPSSNGSKVMHTEKKSSYLSSCADGIIGRGARFHTIRGCSSNLNRFNQ